MIALQTLKQKKFNVIHQQLLSVVLIFLKKRNKLKFSLFRVHPAETEIPALKVLLVTLDLVVLREETVNLVQWVIQGKC